MRMFLDLRIAEDWAEKHLGPTVGRPLTQGRGFPSVTRQVVVDGEEPLAEEIRKKILASERRGESLFCFVNQDYVYSEDELNHASMLILRPAVLVKTYGERHGTLYDNSNVCPKCGAGRVQRSPLMMDPRYLRKLKEDFLVTISADEWIVSAKMANLLCQFSSDSCALEAVCDLQGTRLDDWFQLKVHSEFGVAVPPTVFGLDYFHPDDLRGEYVCSQHWLSGLNLLSELHISPANESNRWPALSVTKNRVGRKAGWIVPAPLLLVSRSLADVLVSNRIRGIGLNVAHVI